MDQIGYVAGLGPRAFGEGSGLGFTSWTLDTELPAPGWSCLKMRGLPQGGRGNGDGTHLQVMQPVLTLALCLPDAGVVCSLTLSLAMSACPATTRLDLMSRASRWGRVETGSGGSVG